MKNYYEFIFYTKKNDINIRIDKLLVKYISFLKITRNKIQKILNNKNVSVNKKQIKCNYKIKNPLELVKIIIPINFYNEKINLSSDNIPLNIIYEDDNIIIINKNSGMVVHPGNGNNKGTLINALKYYFNKKSHFINNDLNRFGLVHRIDKETSGIIIVAKTKYSFEHLSRQFKSRSVTKKYFAIVWGNIEKDEGIIKYNIGRDHKNRMKMNVYKNTDLGKYAVTYYKVVKRFYYVTLISCRLETGRTHQIRVHFKSLGHPIFNDKLYGGNIILKGPFFSKYKFFIKNCFKKIPRQVLHAKYIKFIHPIYKKNISFKCPIPKDIKYLISKFNNINIKM